MHPLLPVLLALLAIATAAHARALASGSSTFWYSLLDSNSVSIECSSSQPQPCPNQATVLFARNASSEVSYDSGGSCTARCLHGRLCAGSGNVHCSTTPPNLLARMADAREAGLCPAAPPSSPEAMRTLADAAVARANARHRPRRQPRGSATLYVYEISAEARLLFCWGGNPLWMIESTPVGGVSLVFTSYAPSPRAGVSYDVPSGCIC
ncbi:uncharacterized protein AMSG_05832 [Thecamonas trahens ATCC 50062]|uniref:Uncharacterized protein n=1 Tax=Thecamonas trahens ATCC 50062 TaxID=461836 RepID=A0A0L0DCM4_THETB|nr:hypothetical protein AMSG_05832 [Thecamonas trahens ATCC 50062]KNC50067.1 hypothetical protein AMSG_05832 [Thecamonas trahens ATCC 50062]|eukprot:XP_013757231.1 hypothetical protein AMSG_05832 [Thecamonas trahens ATCC 50062]